MSRVSLSPSSSLQFGDSDWPAAGLSVALLAALLLKACGDTPVAPPEEDAPTLAMLSEDSTRVVIEPHWLTLDTLGVSDTLTATVLDAGGDTIDDASVTWESADTAIAKVDTAGVVTSVEFGKTKVTATYDSTSAHATVEVAKPLTDREILEIFYEATGGEDWDENENWLSDEDLDDWYGVDAYQGKVSDLVLADNNLVGPIPPELGGLDELLSLVLWLNKLSGAIPPELSKFSGLRNLMLSRNAGITGRLPPELGYTGGLKYLAVDGTDLSGPVPLTFANLDLTRFEFDKDGVCIPAALEEWLDSIPQKGGYQLCTDKIVIDPPSLYLEVPTPGDTVRLAAAVIDAEGDTVRDAEIAWSSADTAIAAVDSTGLVTTVDYGTTEITATSDSLADTARVEIVFKLSNRQVLDSLYRVTGGENWTDTTNWLSDKPLSEWYGVETGDSSGEVVGLSLGNNNLTGSIPDVLAELDSLVALDLGGNALGGRIPWELGELRKLRRLLLNGNELEGLLPRSIGSMAGLRYLHIGDNELSGVVPRSFRNLELDSLYAANSGVCVPPSLDEWYEGIEETDSAARCVASIDIEVVDLPSLSFYAVGETGDLSATYVSAEGDTTYKVPATWTSGDTAVVSVSAAGRVTATGDGETDVTATYDSTSGTIAAEVDLPENDRDVLEILHDRARGDGWTDATNWLSDEPLSEWAGVETDDSGRVVGLSLRNNNLKGPLHSSIGLLDRLATLDLSRNWVSGAIPAELGKLSLLENLTLSVNGFVGKLPSELGELDSLRNINVAVTSLTGRVPASFDDLELESFLVNGTGVCVPPSLAEWLDSIEETDDPPECASRVVVEPASLTFEASGDTARLEATVIDAEGNVVEDAEVTWKSDDTRVARVGATGLVSARASGLTTVTATYDSVTSASAEVAVRLSDGDRTALEAFYRAMGGDDWEDNTNWMSDEPLGEWYGVDTWESGRVRYLELPDNNLVGEIPAAIGLLDSLFSFNLRDTTVTGPIPPAIGRLQRLSDLLLRETHVDGPLPPEMGDMKGLRDVSLDNTRLAGPLPETFADLTLDQFYHDGTDLCVPRSLTEWYESTGNTDPPPCIPETTDREVLVEFYNETGGEDWKSKDNWLTEDAGLNTWRGITIDAEGYVTEVSLPWNNLTDSIPPELSDLRRLEVLSLYGNELTGRIPPELGKLTRVRNLDLSINRLEGPIPPEIGGMVSVDTMFLEFNRLSGPIPAEFGNLVNLELLALFENNLSGPLPAEFGRLKKLKVMRLSHNKIEGPLPPELGDMTALEDLDVGENEITGSIPPELGKLQNLTRMVLGPNELTGQIPPELGNLASLTHLSLRTNRLTGGIPPELGRLSNLELLWIFENELSGAIPAELGDLSKLESLSLASNALTGPIPAELGNLSSVIWLGLFDNELSGSIPAELGGLPAVRKFWLGDNMLSGPIPSELGQLSTVDVLHLHDNELSGPIPPELGLLVNLGAFQVFNNPDLEGLMPRSMTNIPLVRLDARNTRICPHLDDEFQEWLEGIAEKGGLACPTTRIERFALVELYESTGGDSWTNNDGWDSDSDVDDWYGVTVEDSLVQHLRLPGNGLQGSLPAALGSLLALETLDLADNALDGGFPVAIGGAMDALDTIRVSENEDMEGPLPFHMIDLENLRALEYEDTDICASPAPTFQEWIDSLDVAKGATCDNPDSVKLSLPVVYLTQAIQSPEGDMPLISNREALLRVFLVGDQENAFFEPEVFATFTRDGREVHRVVMPSEQDRLPTAADEGSLVKSYNAEIPARYIRDDTEFVIVADSAEVIPRAEGSRTRFPETGTAALDVIEVPPFELTVVPVLNADEPDSSIFEWTDSIDDDSEEVGLFKYSFPLGEFTATSWDTAYVTSLDMTEENNTWPVLLEVETVYKSAEATGYWYAVADSDEGYVRGIARLNGLVSFGKPWDTELAHEVGHTLDLLHAPCGGALATDPDFPYENGSIGVWGYDFRNGSLVSPRIRRDIMGYCYDLGWLSDYYFEKVIRVRENKVEDWTNGELSGAGQKGEMLVLWGGVVNGEPRIEPVHAMYTTPALPRETGPYTLEGITSGGDVEFSLSFTPGEDAYGNKYFLFTIPIEEDWQDSLERITLTGPEGEVTVDSSDPRSLTVVTDPTTGLIRAILRDWDRPLPGALGDTSGLEVVTTRGIREAVRLR